MPFLALLVFLGLLASSKKAVAAPAAGPGTVPGTDALLRELGTTMPDLHPGTRTPATKPLTPAGTIPAGWRVLAPAEYTPALRSAARDISALPPGPFYPFMLGPEKYGAMSLGGQTQILVPM